MLRTLVLLSLLTLSYSAQAGWLEHCKRFLGVVATPLTAQSQAESAAEIKKAQALWQDLTVFWSDQLGPRRVWLRPAKLVFYTDNIMGKCGKIEEIEGPVYCRDDQTLYIAKSFFSEMKDKLGIHGDGFMMYVLSHEFAHHVMHLLKVPSNVTTVASKYQLSEFLENQLTGMQELTVDGLAGFFCRAMVAKGSATVLNLAEGADAAGRLGDDGVAERRGKSFLFHRMTHATNEERAQWFRNGYLASSIDDINAFGFDLILNRFDLNMRTSVRNILRYPPPQP